MMMAAWTNPLDLVIGAAVFGLVLAVFLFCVTLVRARRSARASRIEERLQLLQRGTEGKRVLRLWYEDKQATTSVPHSSWKARLRGRVERFERDLGWRTPPHVVLLGAVGAAGLVGAAIQVISGNSLWALLGGLTVITGFWFYVQRAFARRLALFERQLADALHLAARSLRAGHPLAGAFRLVTEEMDDPIAGVFAEILQQQAMGYGLDTALQKTGSETSCPDLRIFATSVTIQIRTGGNLADMMDRLAVVIRERIRLAQRVRVLTAQTQFSKRVLLVLPIFLFLVLNALNPKYMSILYESPTGAILLSCAAGGMLLGTWMMNRLSRIRW